LFFCTTGVNISPSPWGQLLVEKEKKKSNARNCTFIPQLSYNADMTIITNPYIYILTMIDSKVGSNYDISIVG
jgi:hypothetical protein